MLNKTDFKIFQMITRLWKSPIKNRCQINSYQCSKWTRNRNRNGKFRIRMRISKPFWTFRQLNWMQRGTNRITRKMIGSWLFKREKLMPFGVDDAPIENKYATSSFLYRFFLLFLWFFIYHTEQTRGKKSKIFITDAREIWRLLNCKVWSPDLNFGVAITSRNKIEVHVFVSFICVWYEDFEMVSNSHQSWECEMIVVLRWYMNPRQLTIGTF